MSGLKNGYDWAAYYAAAYEKERKHNTMLAGQVADLERKQEDYRDNLERIYTSPFWKAIAPVHGLFYKESAVAESADSSESGCKDTLEEEDNTCCENEKVNLDSFIVVEGWREIEIPDSDILLLTYGSGVLEQGIFEIIKLYFNKHTSCMAAYVDEDFYEENPACGKNPWYKSDYEPDRLLA